MPPRSKAKAKAEAEVSEARPPPPRGKKRSATATAAAADAADAASGRKRAAAPPAAAAAAPKSDPRAVGAARHWLVKSEPHEYSVDDLAAGKGGGRWDGVRNFSARNNLRAMRRGDHVLFYHSSCAQPAVVAVAEVTSDQAYPDPTAEEAGGRYYDERHTAEAPRWWCVDLRLRRRLRREVTLAQIKRRAAEEGGEVLAGMALLTRPRLSVQPVTAEEWAAVMAMEAEEGEQEGGDGAAAAAAKAGGKRAR